ncbi:MAG: helix-turn-helix domain-containing protein [Paracoccus sp. (in: a-proteobacteria)]|nr:helix-turn-helix domain-containing protein [Paracoccus sp. (in: a-proteobacteria)]
MTQPLTHRGLPDGLTPWKFFELITDARRHLGLSKGAIAYLKVAFSSVLEGDFLPGRVCAFWSAIPTIAATAQLDRRQVERIEAELTDGAYLVKTCRPRCRRTGTRRNGVICDEFGINLAPLIDRAAEICAAARKARFEREDQKRLSRHINGLFADIRNLGDPDANASAEEILPGRRPSKIGSYTRLKAIAAALETVLADFSVDDSPGEMPDQCDISPAPYTKTEKNIKTCRAAKRSAPTATTPAQVWLLASAEMRKAIEFYASANSVNALPDWNAVISAARERGAMLGISRRDWQRRCDQIGAVRAALCLVVADRNQSRTDRFRVRDVTGAFIGIARREYLQTAVLDRLLGELIAFAKSGRHD